MQVPARYWSPFYIDQDLRSRESRRISHPESSPNSPTPHPYEVYVGRFTNIKNKQDLEQSCDADIRC